MSKAVVLVCGTHRVGKTTLVDELMSRYGEPKVTSPGIVESGRGAGVHVDCFPSTAKSIAVVSRLLKEHDVVFVEGAYISTTGVIPLTLLHLAPRQYVVFLYAKASVLDARRKSRPKAGGGKSLLHAHPKTENGLQSRCPL